MSNERLLAVLAIMRAYMDHDVEGLKVLLSNSDKPVLLDVLGFTQMVLDHHHDGHGLDYVDEMARAVYQMHLDDVARQTQ